MYNKFPWTAKQKDVTNIESLAQRILDIRQQYTDSSLADLYDPVLMLKDLRKANKSLDKSILKLYDLKNDVYNNDVLKKLFSMYNSIVSNKTL